MPRSLSGTSFAAEEMRWVTEDGGVEPVAGLAEGGGRWRFCAVRVDAGRWRMPEPDGQSLARAVTDVLSGDAAGGRRVLWGPLIVALVGGGDGS